MMKHNSNIPDTVRAKHEDYNHSWITAHGLMGSDSIATTVLDGAVLSEEDAAPFMVVWLENIRRLCAMLPEGFSFNDYRLIDVGCGSGIASLYFAQHYGFHTCGGFDFSPSLIKMANANAHHMNEGVDSPQQFYVADATTITLNDAPTVLFMFNPFGWHTMGKFLANNIAVLKASNSYLLYANDQHINELTNYGEVIKRDGYFNLSVVSFNG